MRYGGGEIHGVRFGAGSEIPRGRRLWFAPVRVQASRSTLSGGSPTQPTAVGASPAALVRSRMNNAPTPAGRGGGWCDVERGGAEANGGFQIAKGNSPASLPRHIKRAVSSRLERD